MASARWSVQAGRQIYFDGKPFVSIDKEGDTEPVEADGTVIFIVECLNRANITPDDIWTRHIGHPRRKLKYSREARGARRAARPTQREADAGFAIGVYPQHIIEDTARDKFEDVRHNPEFHRETLAAGFVDRDGGITKAGWDQLNEDVGRIEKNSMQWMRKTFINVRDEGHGGHDGDELIGTFWFDPTNPDHAYLVNLAAPGAERIDMVDTSYGDLGNTAFDGVSDFGASVLGGSINFFDIKPEDMETIQETLEHGQRRSKRGR